MQTLDAHIIPDLLANLVERSLVVFDDLSGRYHLSESMRAFAIEQLDAESEAPLKKHCDFFTEYAERISAQNRERKEDAGRALIVAEQDNLRAALDWAFAKAPGQALHLAACVGAPWAGLNITEARSLASNALAVPGGAEADRAWVELLMAGILLRMGERQGVGDLLLSALDRFENRVHDPMGVANALLQLGFVVGLSGDKKRAETLTLRSLEIARKSKLKTVESSALVSLGEQARGRGDLDAAQRHYLEALEVGDGAGFARGVILFNLGSNAILRNEVDEAETYFRKALAGAKAAGQVPNALGALRGISYIAILRGDFRRGGMLTGYADLRRDQLNVKPDPMDADLANQMAAIGRQAGGPQFDSYVVAGKGLSLNIVLELLDA